MYAFLRSAISGSRTRSSDERGFGMVELLCAMGVMSIGILAVFGMFQSSTIAVKRASTVSTAAALADSEMENFRAVTFETIGISSAALGGVDSTYTADAAYRAISTPTNQVNSAVVVTACPAVPCSATQPTRTVAGADGKNYRVDTFITWEAVTSGSGVAGRNVKLVTLVVRDSTTNRVYARVASSFDLSTGSSG
jgi:prepilin-type N-terminal cleavage/methylation domain-containing protein